MRKLACLALLVVTVSGCGSSGGPEVPTIQPAHTYRLAGFEPSGKVEPGKPFRLSFTIEQPNGKPLTAYRRGAGPHTGVHVIVVPTDLSTIVHRHPPVAADGSVSEELTLDRPGTYRVVVDAYPQSGGPAPSSPLVPTGQSNFQLFGTINVAGTEPHGSLAPYRSTVVAGGYRFHIVAKPALAAVQAATMAIEVTDPQGRPATFKPYYGALAHAIFFKEGSLDYFHTHVCGKATPACASFLGASQVAGTSTQPGRLDVGVLVPVSGTWRLFLQTKAGGHVLTAPFTLEVK
jgi:hypothetical protein